LRGSENAESVGDASGDAERRRQARRGSKELGHDAGVVGSIESAKLAMGRERSVMVEESVAGRAAEGREKNVGGGFT
jgi:hypothetical protein